MWEEVRRAIDQCGEFNDIRISETSWWSVMTYVMSSASIGAQGSVAKCLGWGGESPATATSVF